MNCYAEPRLALVYAEDPVELASDLGLRPVETGANVLLTAPRSPVVFERTTTWQGSTIVAPSQAAADLLGGPGRNPAGGGVSVGLDEGEPGCLATPT